MSVVELAPPGTETKLFRDEFQTEMKEQKAMPVQTLVKHAIAGIESGKTEIRPGLSNVLYLLSRLAPGLPFGQMAKMVPPRGDQDAVNLSNRSPSRLELILKCASPVEKGRLASKPFFTRAFQKEKQK